MSEDESLANYWEGWPEAAKRYRASKQEQFERLQDENLRLRVTNDALRQAVRDRDALLAQAARAIEELASWWWSDEIDRGSVLVCELTRVGNRIRAEQGT